MSLSIEQTLNRLIEQGKQTGPADPQAKGLECQLLFRSGYRSSGVLSRTSDGTYRFLAPGRAQSPDGATVDILAEHFFDASALESVIVLHPVEPSRIVLPGTQ